MGLDFVQYLRRLEAETRASKDLAGSMARLMAWANRQQPHADWLELAQLNAQSEIDGGRAWLRRVLEGRPRGFKARGAWFGLGEFADEHGVGYADLRVGLLGHYDANDSAAEWRHSQPSWYPDGAVLESLALRRAGLICNRKSHGKSHGKHDGNRRDEAAPLEASGNIAFGTAFATLLLRQILDADAYRLVGGTMPIGVGMGFDTGDVFLIGELTGKGLLVNQSAFA